MHGRDRAAGNIRDHSHCLSAMPPPSPPPQQTNNNDYEELAWQHVTLHLLHVRFMRIRKNVNLAANPHRNQHPAAGVGSESGRKKKKFFYFFIFFQYRATPTPTTPTTTTHELKHTIQSKKKSQFAMEYCNAIRKRTWGWVLFWPMRDGSSGNAAETAADITCTSITNKKKTYR